MVNKWLMPTQPWMCPATHPRGLAKRHLGVSISPQPDSRCPHPCGRGRPQSGVPMRSGFVDARFFGFKLDRNVV
jgi:hypothetical protein